MSRRGIRPQDCDPPSIIHPQHRLPRGRGHTIRTVVHADARLVSALLVHSKTQVSRRTVRLETTTATAVYRTFIFFSTAQQPLVGQDLLINETTRSHSDTPHSVGLLCTSDQPHTETSTSTWQHTTLTIDKDPSLDRASIGFGAEPSYYLLIASYGVFDKDSIHTYFLTIHFNNILKLW